MVGIRWLIYLPKRVAFKYMKKYLSTMALIVFILPSVAFASWWNPISWFRKSPKPVEQNTVQVPTTQTEKQKTSEEKISELQKQLDDLKKQKSNADSTKIVPTINTTKSKPKIEVNIPITPQNTSSIITSSPPPAWDSCRNINGAQSSVPEGMQGDGNGNCVPQQQVFQNQIMQETTLAPSIKPTIIKLESTPSKARIGQTVTVSYGAENVIKCVLNETSNIEIPFVGNLPEGTQEIQLTSNQFKNNVFTFYLICADKDWNTVKKSLVIPYNPVFSPIQSTSFFSENGNNLGNGGTTNFNGAPAVVIGKLKKGATAIIEMEGKTYNMQPLTGENGYWGIFVFEDLKRPEAVDYYRTSSSHNYTIKFSYTDEYNPLITGSANGAFTSID